MLESICAVVVDDDQPVLRTISCLLKSLPNICVEPFLDTNKAVDFLCHRHIDLLIVDQFMPTHTGLELISLSLPHQPSMAINLISGSASKEIVRSAFRMGASDVLFKPFDSADLLTSVRQALDVKQHLLSQRNLLSSARETLDQLWSTHSRSSDLNAHQTTLSVGDLELDLVSRSLTFNSNPLSLTGVEYLILELLIRRSNTLVTHKEIRKHLTGIDEPRALASENVRVHISSIRRKLGDSPQRPRILRTVWGQGYILFSNPSS